MAALLAGQLGLGVAVGSSPAAAASGCGQRSKVELIAEPSYVLRQYAAASALWPRGHDGAGVIVAVLDSGLSSDNPHFAAPGAVLDGTTFLPEDPTLADLRAPTGRKDAAEHGTAVAGLIAARRIDGSGVAGLAPAATLLPVQVYGIAASDDPRYAAALPKTSQIAAGIRYAADAGAKVIALSMSQDRPDPALEEAVAYARSKGALLVASAGDRLTAANKSDTPRYPAAYPGVVSVTATTTDGRASSTSIHGPHVSIAAPGQQLPTTVGAFGDCVVAAQPESSYAVPLVAAAAALLVQRYPAEGPDLWKYRLEASAIRPSSAVRDDRLGWGLLAPYDALTMTLDPDRPGPVLPGKSAPRQRIDAVQVSPLVLPDDPLARPRALGVWLVFGAAVATLALRLVRTLRSGSGPTTKAVRARGGAGADG